MIFAGCACEGASRGLSFSLSQKNDASWRRIIFLCFTPFLTGCLGDQRNKNDVHQEGGVGLPLVKYNHPPVVDDPERSQAQLDGMVKKIEDHISQSNNANQNSITGVGANVNKLAEHLDASLLRVEANIPVSIKNDLRNEMSAQFSAVATANANLKATIDAQNTMIADLKLHIGDLTAKLEASARGQVALNAKMEETSKEMHAGRDSIDNSVQFNERMQSVIEKSYSTLYWTVMGLCAVIVKIVVILGYRSRSRSETRYISERDERRKLVEKLAHPHGGKHDAAA